MLSRARWERQTRKESSRASVPGKDGYVSIDDGALKLDSGRLTADPPRRYFTPWNAFHAGFLFPLRSMSPV